MPKSSSQASQLDLPKIQTLTYHLSFQYGTAPKAPRFPTVLQYSTRLNNVAIGYIHALQERMNNNEQGEHDSVFKDILSRVRRTNFEPFERHTTRFHPTNMG
jgi:hypothetical protein